jgi:hypothetical protein
MITVFLFIAGVVGLFIYMTSQKHAKREAYIRSFAFPQGVLAKVHKKHAHLSQKDLELVSLGLRHFFLAYMKSGYKPLSMPSQVADDLWHEFILYTLRYQNFCKKAFGRFLHHQPAETLTSKKKSNVALRRCWQFNCQEEIINPRKPSRLPLLFALDAKLNIAKGFFYVTDCYDVRLTQNYPLEKAANGVIYCGGDFSDSSFFPSDSSGCGSSGCGGSSDSSGCSSGCSGGCGGD